LVEGANTRTEKHSSFWTLEKRRPRTFDINHSLYMRDRAPVVKGELDSVRQGGSRQVTS